MVSKKDLAAVAIAQQLKQNIQYKTISLSINQPIGYPSIWHLASIAEKKTTKSVALNPPAKEPLTQENQEKLNFQNVCTFLCHIEAAPREIYDSIMRLQKHLVLVNKQSQKLKTKFINYKKANKLYVIENKQLQAKNKDLEN